MNMLPYITLFLMSLTVGFCLLQQEADLSGNNHRQRIAGHITEYIIRRIADCFPTLYFITQQKTRII